MTPIEELIGWTPVVLDPPSLSPDDIWADHEGVIHGRITVDDLLDWLTERMLQDKCRWKVDAVWSPRTVCWGRYDYSGGGWEFAVSGATLFEALEKAIRQITRQQA